MEGNIWDYRSCMCHPFIHIVSGLHWISEIYMVCFFFVSLGIFCDSSDGGMIV